MILLTFLRRGGTLSQHYGGGCFLFLSVLAVVARRYPQHSVDFSDLLSQFSSPFPRRDHVLLAFFSLSWDDADDEIRFSYSIYLSLLSHLFSSQTSFITTTLWRNARSCKFFFSRALLHPPSFLLLLSSLPLSSTLLLLRPRTCPAA